MRPVSLRETACVCPCHPDRAATAKQEKKQPHSVPSLSPERGKLSINIFICTVTEGAKRKPLILPAPSHPFPPGTPWSELTWASHVPPLNYRLLPLTPGPRRWWDSRGDHTAPPQPALWLSKQPPAASWFPAGSWWSRLRRCRTQRWSWGYNRGPGVVGERERATQGHQLDLALPHSPGPCPGGHKSVVDPEVIYSKANLGDQRL